MSGLGVWDCPYCQTRCYNVGGANTPAGANFIICPTCKKKTKLDQKTKEPINMAREKKNRVRSRSVVELEDTRRKVTVTVQFDDKGFKGENAGLPVRLVNDVMDALRKIANAHEIRVKCFNKVSNKGGK